MDQSLGPGPGLRTQNGSDSISAHETLTQAWPHWVSYPSSPRAPTHPSKPCSGHSPPSILWRISSPAPRSHHSQDHVVCCHICPHCTKQEQGRSESYWGSQGPEQSLGWESQLLVQPPLPLACCLTLGSLVPPQALLSPRVSRGKGQNASMLPFSLEPF